MPTRPSHPGQSTTDNPTLGVALMVTALFLLSGMDAIAKHLTETLATPQILAVRFWIFFLFASALAARRGYGRTARSTRPVLQIVRTLVLAAEMSLFVWAFSRMPLADVHAIAAVAPLLTTGLAAVFLGERVGPRRWTAIAFGFLGVLIVIRPGLGVFDPISLAPLAGAFGWAVYQILLRRVAATDSPETTTLYTAAVGLVCFSIAAPFVWRDPSGDAWLWLLAVGVLGSIGHFLLPAAFARAPASTLQPFAFTMPVWAAILGWLVFDHIPDSWTFLGGAIIIASGLYAFRREQQRAPRSNRSQ